jgi:hypothetical protein
MLPALRGRRDTADLGPKLESPGPGGSVVGGGNVLAVERKKGIWSKTPGTQVQQRPSGSCESQDFCDLAIPAPSVSYGSARGF